jgi:hypothetical protein
MNAAAEKIANTVNICHSSYTDSYYVTLCIGFCYSLPRGASATARRGHHKPGKPK